MFRELIFRDPLWTEIFAPEGRILREGEIVHRTNYSRTLMSIASEGPEAFYKVRPSSLSPSSLQIRVRV